MQTGWENESMRFWWVYFPTSGTLQSLEGWVDWCSRCLKLSILTIQGWLVFTEDSPNDWFLIVRTNLKTDLLYTLKDKWTRFENVKSWRDFEFSKVESKFHFYLGEGFIRGGDAGNVQQLQSKLRKGMHMRLLCVQIKECFGVWVTRSRVCHDEMSRSWYTEHFFRISKSTDNSLKEIRNWKTCSMTISNFNCSSAIILANGFLCAERIFPYPMNTGLVLRLSLCRLILR
jgi:hypothetical protein